MSALSIKTVYIINSVLSCMAYLFHNKIGNTITINPACICIVIYIWIVSFDQS